MPKLLEGVSMTTLGRPLVRLGKVFGGPVSYANLAVAFQVSPYDILREVYKASGKNKEAFDIIFQDFVKTQRPGRVEGSPEGRRYQYWSAAHGNTSSLRPEHMPYLHWKLPADVTLALPASTSATDLVRADRTQASKIIKLALDRPDLAKVQLLADTFEDLAGRIEERTESLDKFLTKKGKEGLHFILAAQRLQRLLLNAIDNPKAWVVHDGIQNEAVLDAITQLTDDISEEFSDPKGKIGKSYKKDIDKLAQEALDELERPESIKLIKSLSAYYTIAEQRETWDDLEASLQHIVKALARTPICNRLLSHHVMPFWRNYVESFDPTPALAHCRNKDLKAAILDDWRGLAPANKNSVLAALGTLGSTVSSSVGNSAGPSSLAVSIVLVAGPWAAQHLAVNAKALGKGPVAGAGLALRVLLRVDNFTQTDTKLLFDAIDKQDLAALKKIQWDEKLMTGHWWAGLYALANLAVMLAAIKGTDDEVDLEKIVQIVNSGAQTVVPLGEIAAALLKERNDWLSKEILSGTRRLAFFAGGIAAMLALYTIYKEIEEYNEVGSIDFDDILTFAGAAGTIVSVGGWVAIEGFGLAATGIMAVGTFVAVGAMVIALAYETAFSDPGTAVFLGQCVAAFEQSPLCKELCTSESSGPGKSFKELKNTLHRYSGKIVSLAGEKDEALFLSRYFSVDSVATIVEMNPAILRAILEG